MSKQQKWFLWVNRNPIQVYMSRKGADTTEIAGSLNVSRTTVYYWLAGDRVPSARHLDALASLRIASAASYASWWAENPNPSAGRVHKRPSRLAMASH
jgi:transcriptional regulator with XRE-family HTH domain